jgi:hypothetical protein
MTPPTRGCFRNIRIVSSNSHPCTARRPGAAFGRETLMPYEAAAKAIFIRANGAAAYYEATGLSPAANDA